jgi:hypothetical protein
MNCYDQRRGAEFEDRRASIGFKLKGIARMDGGGSRLQGNAAGIVILTICGMLAGLGCGVIWSWVGRDDPFRRIGQVASGGFFGMVFGLGLAILLVARGRGTFRSVKKTMIFIAAAAVVVWAIMTLVRALNR